MEYEDNNTSFWEDFYKYILVGILFLFPFLVLIPFNQRWKRTGWRNQNAYFFFNFFSNIMSLLYESYNGEDSAFKNNNNDENVRETSRNRSYSDSYSNKITYDEEETDEERFEKNWQSICSSEYHRLVLPPICKLVKRTIILPKKEEQSLPAKITDGNEGLQSDDDQPATRLHNYLRQLLYFVRSFLSYDYFNAGLTIISWIQACIRFRHRRSTCDQNVEEDDDDDSSRSSILSTKRKHSTTLQTNNAHAPTLSIMERDTVRHPLHFDEKKEPANVNAGSVVLPKLIPDENSYDGSMVDTGKSDAGTNLKNKRFPLHQQKMQQNTRKKKDALESYRSKFQSPKTSKALNPIPTDDASLSSLESKKDDPDMGSYFFETANSQDCLRQMAWEAPLPDKNNYIVGDEYLPDSRYTPLLVFVNSRSGPRQGHMLIAQLRRLLNPIQVWDLADGAPEMLLESFCTMTRLRILVCGGDGTVSWIISVLEKMNLKRKWPPIAILPLGTGNDLARIHGWGGGYNNESLIDILKQVAESYISLLDRWEISITNKKGKVKSVKNFFNYLGVGSDAQAALQVHMLRESKPQLFFSRVVNKAWYGVFASEDIIKATSLNLRQEVTLIADGMEIPLPPDSQGIILLNIDSYASGIPMWSHGSNKSVDNFARRNVRRSKSLHDLNTIERKTNFLRQDRIERIDSLEDLRNAEYLSEEEKFARVTACDRPSSCQDGLLDIVSIRGMFHLGQITVGLSNAERLCQCREAKIVIKKKMAVQIDGEPWRQNICTIHVKRKKESAMMLHRSPNESRGVETEMAKLLDWAEERNLIDAKVHTALMKEFSRRIESKTRKEKRVSFQGNIMHSLKRAIANTSGKASYHIERKFGNIHDINQ